MSTVQFMYDSSITTALESLLGSFRFIYYACLYIFAVLCGYGVCIREKMSKILEMSLVLRL